MSRSFKLLSNIWLSLAAPLLILISIFGLTQRHETNRLQSLPAFLVGTGLIVSSAASRKLRRSKILLALRDVDGKGL
ncbi:DUF3188 domain-containing protein [Prochlorococcus sp. MIT 1341]|uniref:DUF3188 domain-containing protein n=1 Tax=Prochlorococcus sp. MIT 1341 TaxID=3096221 RepID=UPI002A74EEB0|nr:DUF3188 domain-containing protein [Prochlorococcus sp. MIT 1341]